MSATDTFLVFLYVFDLLLFTVSECYQGDGPQTSAGFLTSLVNRC